MNQLSGLKNTPPRLAIFSVLKMQQRPLNVLEILELVKNKADLATIYRTLEIFFDKGLINKVEFGEGKYRYELKRADHHHLICSNCEKIEDISDGFMEDFEKEIKSKKGFLVKSHSLEFFGLCKNCQN